MAKHWRTVANTFNSAVARGSGSEWFVELLAVSFSFSPDFLEVPCDDKTPCEIIEFEQLVK